jgi:hypothetical protein
MLIIKTFNFDFDSNIFRLFHIILLGRKKYGSTTNFAGVFIRCTYLPTDNCRSRKNEILDLHIFSRMLEN